MPVLHRIIQPLENVSQMVRIRAVAGAPDTSLEITSGSGRSCVTAS